MEVVAHGEPGEFARLARPLLEPDPVRHTLLLTVLDAVCRGAFPPAALLTAHDEGVVVGALLRTEGRGALVSAVPPPYAPAMAAALAEIDPDVPGAYAPVAEAEAFAVAWTALTGTGVQVGLRMRLFALEGLRPPADVPGRSRAVGRVDDPAVDVLAAWRTAFGVELGMPAEGPSSQAVVLDAVTAGGGEMLWEVDDIPVAQASARPVTAGMSRIGPVYTPPEHRRHGYAAAVTAAAARWALDQGARDVLLFTDLANPTTNRLYPRLGFRPRHDTVDLRFAPASEPVRPK